MRAKPTIEYHLKYHLKEKKKPTDCQTCDKSNQDTSFGVTF